MFGLGEMSSEVTSWFGTNFSVKSHLWFTSAELLLCNCFRTTLTSVTVRLCVKIYSVHGLEGVL